MKTGGELIGFLIFLSDEFSFSEKDYNCSLKIANMIGSVLKNAIDYYEMRNRESEKGIQIDLLIDLQLKKTMFYIPNWQRRLIN